MADINFEDIQPFVEGQGDTGKTAREKINRNFQKLKGFNDAVRDIRALETECLGKISQFGHDYYKEFASGEVPSSAVESFGFGGKTGDMLQIVVNATGYVSGQKFLELYGKATSNGEWAAISGCSWYVALDRRVTLENDYAEIGFKLGSTVDEAEVKASLLDEKAALSDISAKIEGYYTCLSSAQDNKTINAKWFRLRNGSKIIIKFTYSNTKPTPVTLNINGTGAKNIYINGKQAGLDNTWKKGSVCLCWYDANEQHYNLKVLFDDDGDLSESVGILNDLYLNSSDWEDVTNSVSLTAGFKYDVNSTTGYEVGHMTENSGYSYSEPIHLNKGEAIRVKSYGNSFCPIQESDENGNILARLVTYTGSDAYNDYSYIATKDMYVVVNVRIHNTYSYKIEKSGGLRDVDFSKIPLIDELWLNCIDWGEDLANNTEVVSEYILGKYRPSTGISGYALDESTSYAYSSPIQILRGQSVRIRCYGNNLIPLMECDDSGNVLSIMCSYPTSDVNKYTKYSFVANRDMYIKICGRTQDSAYPSSLYISSTLMSFDIIRDAIKTVYDDSAAYRTPILTTDDITVGETLFYKIEGGSNNVQLAWIGEGSTVPFERVYIHTNNGAAEGKMIVPDGFVRLQSQDNSISRLTIVRPGTLLANRIAQELMQEKIDELSNGTNLPSYYKEYIDGKEKEIRNIQLDIDGNEDSFIFVTDTHWIDNYKQSPAIIESLLKRGLTNKVVFGGDLMGLHSNIDGEIEEGVNQPSYYESLELIRTQIDFHRKFASIVLSCGARFFNVRGNHDINGFVVTKATQTANEYSTSSEYFWRASENSTKNILFDQIEENGRISNREGSNYVYDNDKKKIRYIFVGDAKENNNPQYSFPYASVDWFVERLADTPASYDIVVICHYGALPSTLTNCLPDMDNIITAFNGRGAVNVVRTIDNETITKSKNFEGATSKVIAYISGHTHKNLQSFSAGVVHICTSCDASYSKGQYMNEKAYSTSVGTETEQLLDFIQLDKYANMIYCKRIGGGYDRYFHTQQNTVANGSTIELTTTELSGELEWGCYDNKQPVTKTSSTQITSSRVTVSNGVVSAIVGAEEGEAVVYAMDETGNREFFEVIVN